MTDARKILVTGGAGFIGSHLVDLFLELGKEVLVLDNFSTGSRANLREGIHFYELDIRSRESREVILNEKPDIIVHAAAQISVSESMKKPEEDVDINVRGLVNLLCVCKDSYKPYFIFFSTGGALYGDQEVFPAPETHKVLPESIYGLSKYVSEYYLDFWAREFGLSYSALRLANVYGPRQNPHGEAGVVAIFCEKLLKRGAQPVIFGTGEQTRDFIYVGDVVEAVKRVAEKRVKGVFNIGTGKETNVNEIYKYICDSLHTKVEARKLPQRPGEQLRSCIDSRLAKKSFGWQASVSIEEGIKKTSDWFAKRDAVFMNLE